MDVKKYIQMQIAAAWRTSDDVTSNLTDELLNWTPPGTANPISGTLAHILGGEDRFIQALILGKPRIFDAENWGDRIGVGVLPRPGVGWDEYRGRKLSVDTFKAYQEKVRAATNAYLETVSPEELERRVDFAGRDMSVADVLVLLVIHITEHSGEIAALKGIQGAKGLGM
ncbi:MAG: DinB family protein [Bacteroidetes bacterium]|nr:DinB family protein [Bacteroidota bacterium]